MPELVHHWLTNGDSPALGRVRADSSPFDKIFAQLPGEVMTAPNLSGDATLVIPRPPGDWPHLAAFVRTAPAERLDARPKYYSHAP